MSLPRSEAGRIKLLLGGVDNGSPIAHKHLKEMIQSSWRVRSMYYAGNGRRHGSVQSRTVRLTGRGSLAAARLTTRLDSSSCVTFGNGFGGADMMGSTIAVGRDCMCFA